MFLGLSQAKWGSLLRTFGTVILTWLISSGKLTNEQAGQITSLAIQASPALGILGLMIWGLVTRSDKNIAAEAGKLPGVNVLVSDSAPAGAKAAAADPTITGVTKA